MFHGKEETDKLGRSWMAAPKEQKPEVEQAFLPKRWIHTWSGHTKGVNAIRHSLSPKTPLSPSLRQITQSILSSPVPGQSRVKHVFAKACDRGCPAKALKIIVWKKMQPSGIGSKLEACCSKPLLDFWCTAPTFYRYNQTYLNPNSSPKLSCT